MVNACAHTVLSYAPQNSKLVECGCKDNGHILCSGKIPLKCHNLLKEGAETHKPSYKTDCQ